MGNIKALTGDALAAQVYTYTGNRLSTVTGGASRTYTYDANGNALTDGTNTFGYTYQTNTNKLSAVSNYATYTYDALGQMASQTRTGGAGYYVDYDVTGKVTSIYSDAAKTILRVSFGYDELGNKIRKTDHIQNIITYYVNDASGNLLAIYDNKGTAMQQKELPIYAASRVGTYNRPGNSYQYELTDHLGNVRAVINGTKLAGGQADVVYYSDYYPYGSPLTLAANDYRYGYQGQYAEVDKETGWNNFDLRMYDPAIGRWMSTDPYGQFNSPYIGMGNNPVNSVDPDGGYSWFKGFFKWMGSGFKGDFGKAKSGDRKGEWFIGSKDNYIGEGAGVAQKLDFGEFTPPPLKIQNQLNKLIFLEDYIKRGGILNSMGRPIATGRADPNYFFEEMVIGGAVARGGGLLYEGLAAKVVTNTITRSESALGHIFRDAAGHVNPSTIASQNRYISIFENIANNPVNLNPNVLTNFQRTAGGFQGYSQIFRNGTQVWTQTFNGKIINAGVNIIPK